MYAVPDEERGTRTAAAVDLQDVLHLVGSDFDFVLQHAGRPQHADDVRFFRLSKADGQVGRVLSEISRRSVYFKLLPQSGREHFNLRTDSVLVVVQALERESQRIVLVSALVAQQDSRTLVLRDQQIDGAIVIVVPSDDRAWRLELNFVEAGFGGDIFEAVGTEIAEEADFAFAVFGL